MADIELISDVTPRGNPNAQSGWMGIIANLTGAVLSLCLLAGVGVWAYKLIVRDVTGVPVVRALDGPMRIQPENPGGRPADHQGLAVNAVAADGSAAAPADRLILAPRPIDLAAEDQPATQGAGPATPPVEEEPPRQLAEIDALVAQITGGAALREVPDPAPAPVSAAAAIVAPAPVVIDTATPSRVSASVRLSPDVPGLATSLRPQRRPAESAVGFVTPAALAPVALALDIDPADVPAGTRVVQLGAYESGEMARLEWDRLAVQFGDYMLGKRRIVQQASSGGRTFFRLRVHGFDDLSDARRFCSALVAEGADCIPVVTR